MEDEKNRPPTSRLIIKNIPKHFTEERLIQAFSKFGVITDAKIIGKKSHDQNSADTKKSRQFAYVGFKTEDEAIKTKKYFHGTYLDTSKIIVDFAYPQNSEYIPRAWSRHSKDSSAYLLQHKSEAERLKKLKSKENSENKTNGLEEIEKKKEKYKSFLEYISKKKAPKQSWNDVFNNYVPQNENESEHQEAVPTQEKPKQSVTETNLGKIKATKVARKTKAGVSDVKTHITFNEEPENKDDKMEDIVENAKDLLEKEDKKEKEEKKVEQIRQEAEIDDKRLYVMNLPFSTTEDEISDKFSKYGNVENVFIVRNLQTGISKGFAYVTFTTAESSIDAFAHLDKTIFQGRKLHILPAQKKPESSLKTGIIRAVQPQKNENPSDPKNENVPENTSDPNKADAGASEQKIPTEKMQTRSKSTGYKRNKAEELKRNYDEETNWNYLFLNPNTVAASMATKLHVSKGELLSKDADNAAVRLALSETHLIKETKDWLKSNGVNVFMFDGETRKACKRSDKILMIKNISDKATEAELRELFERYGELKRLLVSPSNTLALVEYKDHNSASVAMKKNAYYLLHGLPLYLEYAPEGILDNKNSEHLEKIPEANPESEEDGIKYGRTIFVKNLNFETSEQKLTETFETAKAGKIVSVRIVKNRTTGKSMGYGFVEYATEEAAINCIKTLQNVIVDEHSLKLSISKKKLAEKQIKEIRSKLKRKALTEEDNPEANNNKTGKLLVKNLAFEATKKDIKQLFSSFGQIKNIRIPKKYDGTHRGFSFVEFFTKDDAKNAFKSLQSSHLYGRKLVIQWAKDTELSTKELQEKTEQKYEALSKENAKGIMTHEKAQLVVNQAEIRKNKRKKFDEEEDLNE